MEDPTADVPDAMLMSTPPVSIYPIAIQGDGWHFSIMEKPRAEIIVTGKLPTRLEFYTAFRSSQIATAFSLFMLDILYCVLRHAHTHTCTLKETPHGAPE